MNVYEAQQITEVALIISGGVMAIALSLLLAVAAYFRVKSLVLDVMGRVR